MKDTDRIPARCECGHPARHAGQPRHGQRPGCDRCIAIEDRMNIRKTTSGIKTDEQHIDHRRVKAACNKFLRARGLTTKGWHA